MTRKGDRWTLEAEVEPGMVSYKFIVDGKWINDPANPETITENGAVNSVINVE
jgi:hypothetical protein